MSKRAFCGLVVFLLLVVGVSLNAGVSDLSSSDNSVSGELVSSHQVATLMTLKEFSRAFLSKPELVGSGTTKETNLKAEYLSHVAHAFEHEMKTHKKFNNAENWIGSVARNVVGEHTGEIKIMYGGMNDYKYAQSGTVRYIQKMAIAPGSVVSFMGDFHGSDKSLVRNLWRLVALGYLNEDLTIKRPNFYMVFLGDYVDRGYCSAEVVALVTTLKLKNVDKVHLLAGNHETGLVPLRDGFYNEIKEKFNDEQLFKTVYEKIFMNLPVALFIECNGNFIQCCHGGIETNVEPLDFLKDKSKLFQNVGTELACMGLFWSDFCASQPSCTKSARGAGQTSGHQCTLDYLQKNSDQDAGVNLKAFMRAHQDMEFGLKLFMDPKKNNDKYCDPQFAKEVYQQSYANICMYHWTEVAKKLGIKDNTFSLSRFDYYPVFTWTSAVGPRAFPYDCFGLVNVGRQWDQWKLKVYELFLDKMGKNYRDRGFVFVGPADTEDGQTNLMMPDGPIGVDPIGVYWVEEADHDVDTFESLMDGVNNTANSKAEWVLRRAMQRKIKRMQKSSSMKPIKPMAIEEPTVVDPTAFY